VIIPFYFRSGGRTIASGNATLESFSAFYTNVQRYWQWNTE